MGRQRRRRSSAAAARGASWGMTFFVGRAVHTICVAGTLPACAEGVPPSEEPVCTAHPTVEQALATVRDCMIRCPAPWPQEWQSEVVAAIRWYAENLMGAELPGGEEVQTLRHQYEDLAEHAQSASSVRSEAQTQQSPTQRGGTAYDLRTTTQGRQPTEGEIQSDEALPSWSSTSENCGTGARAYKAHRRLCKRTKGTVNIDPAKGALC